MKSFNLKTSEEIAESIVSKFIHGYSVNNTPGLIAEIAKALDGERARPLPRPSKEDMDEYVDEMAKSFWGDDEDMSELEKSIFAFGYTLAFREMGVGDE